MSSVNRLKMLRLAKGLTLDELANDIGGIVTKQALSKYERDQSRPSLTTSRQLARVLGVKTAHLFATPRFNVELIGYRKRTTLRVSESNHLENLVKLQLEDRVQLQERLEGPSLVQLPSLKVSSLEEVEKAATELRRLWDLGLDPISNITDALESRRVHVLEIEASKQFDGISAFVRDDSGEIIAAGVVSRIGVSGERQRMNLAHEVSHIVTKPVGIDGEDVAKRFAGAFLFPEEAVRLELGNRRRDLPFEELAILKSRYGISMSGIVFRAVNLGIVSQDYKTEFFKTTSPLGWRTAEPNPLPPEQSRRWKQIVTRGLSERLISRDEAAPYLNQDEIEDILPNIDGVSRRAFLMLPLTERRKLMAKAVNDATKSELNMVDSEIMEWIEAELEDGFNND